jgi:hypothetical protein
LGAEKQKGSHNQTNKNKKKKKVHKNHTNKKALSSPRLARISFIEKKSRALLERRKRLLTTDTIEHKAVTTQQPKEEGFVCFDDV